MSGELKPCPHCGAPPVLRSDALSFVYCTRGDECHGGTGGYETAEEAIAFWNRRAVEDALRARLTEAERLLSNATRIIENIKAYVIDAGTLCERLDTAENRAAKMEAVLVRAIPCGATDCGPGFAEVWRDCPYAKPPDTVWLYCTSCQVRFYVSVEVFDAALAGEIAL